MRQCRPFGVTALAAYYLVGATFTAVFVGFKGVRHEDIPARAELVWLVCTTFLLAIGAATGIGMFALRDWARRWAVTISATYAVVALASGIAVPLMLDHGIGLVFMALSIGIALLHYVVITYLRSDEIARAFA